MAVSKAHIKASNKYNKENYSKIQANISKDDYNIIDTYCKQSNTSKAQLIVNACKLWIETHPLDTWYLTIILKNDIIFSRYLKQ